jgi:hypothetical protein
METPFQIKVSPGDRKRGRPNHYTSWIAMGMADPGQSKKKDKRLK